MNSSLIKFIAVKFVIIMTGPLVAADEMNELRNHNPTTYSYLLLKDKGIEDELYVFNKQNKLNKITFPRNSVLSSKYNYQQPTPLTVYRFDDSEHLEPVALADHTKRLSSYQLFVLTDDSKYEALDYEIINYDLTEFDRQSDKALVVNMQEDTLYLDLKEENDEDDKQELDESELVEIDPYTIESIPHHAQLLIMYKKIRDNYTQSNWFDFKDADNLPVVLAIYPPTMEGSVNGRMETVEIPD